MTIHVIKENQAIWGNIQYISIEGDPRSYKSPLYYWVKDEPDLDPDERVKKYKTRLLHSIKTSSQGLQKKLDQMKHDQLNLYERILLELNEILDRERKYGDIFLVEDEASSHGEILKSCLEWMKSNAIGNKCTINSS